MKDLHPKKYLLLYITKPFRGLMQLPAEAVDHLVNRSDEQQHQYQQDRCEAAPITPPPRYLDPSVHPIPLQRMLSEYYLSLARELTTHGHPFTFSIMISQEPFLPQNGFSFRHRDGYMLRYCGTFGQLKGEIEEADVLILRGNYKEYNTLYDGFELKGKKVIYLPTHCEITYQKNKFPLSPEDSTVLVDDTVLTDTFEKASIPAEVFLKPAADLFYAPIEEGEKQYDFLMICPSSDRAHKRFDLVLEALHELEQRAISLTFLLVGNHAAHRDQIEEFQRTAKSVQLIARDRVPLRGVREALDQTRVSICASDRDANPRIIVESLARDVPVLCADDLACGRFQINHYTGTLFSPTPGGLANAMEQMMDRLDDFQPRAHCITLNQTVEQFKRLAR